MCVCFNLFPDFNCNISLIAPFLKLSTSRRVIFIRISVHYFHFFHAENSSKLETYLGENEIYARCIHGLPQILDLNNKIVFFFLI